MDRIFVSIYQYLSEHKKTMWVILILPIIVMAALVLRVEYVEDITAFFPKNSQTKNLFNNLKSKDKIAIMITADSDDIDSQYLLMDCVDSLEMMLLSDTVISNIAVFQKGVNDEQIDNVTTLILDYIPLFLQENDYARLDSIIENNGVNDIMLGNYQRLISPIGNFVSDYVFNDPFSLAGGTLKDLEKLGANFNYAIIDNYIFSKDKKTIITYIEPLGSVGSSNQRYLVNKIESIENEFIANYPDVEFQYFGAPIVAEHNARQIKKDSMLTLNIAIIIVVVLLSFVFRNKFSALFILMPVVYGALFALSLISIIKGSISIIAIGAGSIIFGIAMSYAIHYLSHSIHTREPKEIIADLAYPLTVGSFTTIGAFLGLLFTTSTILRDLGLFASLTLIGTVVFVLVFLPHFIKNNNDENKKEGHILRWAARITDIPHKTSRIIAIAFILLAIVGLRYSKQVGFDNDMMNLNYMPTHLGAAEQKLNSFSMSAKGGQNSQLFFTTSIDKNDAVGAYNDMCNALDALINESEVESYTSIKSYLFTDSVLKQKCDRWNRFWTKERKEKLVKQMNGSIENLGFEDGAFDGFIAKIDNSFVVDGYINALCTAFPEWVNIDTNSSSFIAHVKISDEKKTEVYEKISQDERIVVADRAFFANKMAEDTQHNFTLALYISSILVFVAMLLCYGRIELTLMAFTPMLISWIIILAIMALLDIQFNIVTIILSTFIFGIGDDFSIFMMDGLQGEYKNGKSTLSHHKVAILFSAFTIVVGMGVMIFAKHPAMYSLGVMSLLGILIVVLVSLTVQPMLFSLFISKYAAKGGFPFTLLSLIFSLTTFTLFLLGCVVIQLFMLIVLPLPIGRKRRVAFIHYCVHYFCKCLIKAVCIVKKISINESKETFKKPAVIIANHQSFLDILLMLALNPKVVMVTNDWVWNSPFFGKIVRYLGFFNVKNGYEIIVDSLQKKVNEGYSIVIFPEGTRSIDCELKRFHKGAFYLSEKLNLDIIPVLIYGSGLLSSKSQCFYLKNGVLATKILGRIPPKQQEYGIAYQDRCKSISKYFRQEYQQLYEQLNRVDNAYFREAIVKNYMYKGPVLEWYMRVKLRFERWYDAYDSLLPRSGNIVDLGCGYGAMTYMLSMLSSKRNILGIDYDEEKIAVANNAFLKNDKVSFAAADIRTYELPNADAFVISDVLHYINYQEQENVISNCINKLADGGILVIKDGDSSLEDKHKNTETSEKWSTQIVKFNKTDGELHFLSWPMIQAIAEKYNLDAKKLDSTSRLSNVIYVLTKK